MLDGGILPRLPVALPGGGFDHEPGVVAEEPAARRANARHAVN